MNASLAPDESAIVQHNTVNIGIAMATPYGLVVPNIKGVQVGRGRVCKGRVCKGRVCKGRAYACFCKCVRGGVGGWGWVVHCIGVGFGEQVGRGGVWKGSRWVWWCCSLVWAGWCAGGVQHSIASASSA